MTPEDLGQRGVVSERKFRLVACNFARLVWPRIGRTGRRAVEVAERYAAGLVPEEELVDAHAAAFGRRHGDGGPTALGAVCAGPDAREAARFLANHPDLPFRRQAPLVREIFGNPFRPLQPGPFPDHVIALARACEEALPDTADEGLVPDEYLFLADALEESGELAAAEHCREGRHVPGCYVVEWIFGRGERPEPGPRPTAELLLR
jgi:hypothetical protein